MIKGTVITYIFFSAFRVYDLRFYYCHYKYIIFDSVNFEICEKFKYKVKSHIK